MAFSDQDRAKFVTLMQALAGCYHKQADEPMLLGYELGLDDLPITDVNAAVRRAIKERQFMPSPAELRELAGVPKDSDRAALAWEVFAKQVGLLGAYKTVFFDDPIINATCRNLGGWQRCCIESDDKDKFETWLKKEFKSAYETLCRTGVCAENCGPLGGIVDQTNGHLGVRQAPVHRFECKLPSHRRDLIRGDVAKTLPQPIQALIGASEVGAMR